jgi:protein-S-isoprenylcysteine O-methyltransferase Ste14
MTQYIGALTLILLVGMVDMRVQMLKAGGISAMQFGKIDKMDFLLLPFALFYFYIIFAHALGWPGFNGVLFHSEMLAEVGILFCLIGLGLMAWSLVSFGRSFRVGIDTQKPDKLVTTGVFGFSRNPIYVAFAVILLGEFLIFPNLIPLLYIAAGIFMFHRQVLREESFLKEHYGEEYREYCGKVRRYI